MKKLKLNHKQAKQVLKGAKTTTWRLFDDKDLSVNDEVALVDKVKPDQPDTWRDIGVATITSIVQKRLEDITKADMAEHETFVSGDKMLTTFRDYYGPNVTWQTPVSIIHFSFSSELPTPRTEILPVTEKVLVYADGGSRGNPGPSAGGYVIYDGHNKVLVHRGVYIGITTNNQAEYTGLKSALEEAKSLHAKEVHVYMDSLLVVNQMNGKFKIRNRDLWPLHDAVKQLCIQFEKVTFTQIPREMNKLADAAVNEALDEALRANRHH